MFTDYFNGECYDVCLKRLQVLIESNLDVCAYNFTTFLVKQIFEESQTRQRFPFLHNQWLGKDQDKANSILDIHLALIYRRKEDTAYLQYFVRVQIHKNFPDFPNFE